MKGIIRSLLVSLWFMFLTFPLLVIKITPSTGAVTWRLSNILYLGLGIFVLSFIWRALLVRKGIMAAKDADLDGPFTFLLPKALRPQNRETAHEAIAPTQLEKLWGDTLQTLASLTRPGLPRLLLMGALAALLIPLPFWVNIYQVNVLTSALIWIMLGLGLNIVVGQTGLLVLGYVAFYAVGAYAYALANLHFGGSFFGFWLMLPLGGFLAAMAGIALSLPVLRLRGDYLAIVTLGFGEIVRVVLESGSLSLAPFAALYSFIATPPAWMTTPLDLGGPAGISNIPYPGFFGIPLSIDASIRYVYYIALALALITIVAVTRLRDSRLGRSWMALREDEIACEAMGINKSLAKLTSFALGACWAGFGGVLFAAKTSFINPSSFTFMESALILSVVVLGGLGSVLGVILGACVLILLPEYLRSFNEYRMLIFGASMVLMMVFRPQGLITPTPKRRFPKGSNEQQHTATMPAATTANATLPASTIGAGVSS